LKPFSSSNLSHSFIVLRLFTSILSDNKTLEIELNFAGFINCAFHNIVPEETFDDLRSNIAGLNNKYL
jgi:hypothetical protein